MPAVKTEKTRHPRLALQARHIHVQIHPVDPLELQGHVLAQNLAQRCVLCSSPAPVGSGPSGSNASLVRPHDRN